MSLKLFFFTLFLSPFVLCSQNLDAQFPGGEKALFHYLEEELVYPKEAIENGIGGIITILFVVNENGRVKDVRAVNTAFDYPRNKKTIKPDIEQLLVDEALRGVITLPVWRPAFVDGVPIASLLRFRIKFNNKSNFFDFDFGYHDDDKTRFYSYELSHGGNLGAEVKRVDMSRSKQHFKILEPDMDNLLQGYEPPRFTGKDRNIEKYFTTRYTYPYAARIHSLSAVIVAGFTISKNGTVTNANIINAKLFSPRAIPVSDTLLESEFRKEMIRIINNMPQWIPGTFHSEFVETHFVIELHVVI